MEPCNKAPLARMSAIAPSLESLTSNKSSRNSCIIPLKSSAPTPPNIPDGGWGWVIVIAAFILSVIADGVTFCFGLLYVEFLKEFESSNTATSWIGSLFMAVPLLSGPIMSGLVDEFGCRSMTIVGGLVSSAGFILCSKCYSLGLMYLTFGVLTGLGLGLIYVTIVVSVAFWFDKKRTLAVAVSSSGIGIGTFVFAPLTTLLIAEYGWRGATFVLGGCFLNMCVCGALMRDPDWIRYSSPKIDREELKALLTNETFLQDLGVSIEDTPTALGQSRKLQDEVLELLSTNKNVYNVIESHYPTLLLRHSYSVDGKENAKDISAKLSSVHEHVTAKNHEKYFNNLKIVDKRSLVHKGTLFNTTKYTFKASSCPNIYRVSMISLPRHRKEKWYSDMAGLIKGMFDFSLLFELHFFFFSLSTIILFTWFVVPYFYLADFMEKTGYSKGQISLTLSNIGIFNTLGKIVLGWAGDRTWMNITKIYALCLVLCGISVAGQVIFVQNFLLLQLCAAAFGICFSSHFAFTPGIVMELVPLDQFTVGYGLQLLCQGIGTLVGPPCSGFLFDYTKTWRQSFYQAGIWIILSGVFVGMIPYTKNRKLVRKRPKENEEDLETK